MAWDDSPSDERQLRLMKEAGLNISGFCKPADLEKAARAGLSCIVEDERVSGCSWRQMPEPGVIRSNLQSLKRDITGKSAAIGLLLGDEPNARVINGMGHPSTSEFRRTRSTCGFWWT